MSVAEDLLTQTLVRQDNLFNAINASATLLLAASIYGRSQMQTTILDIEAILKGYGLDSLKRFDTNIYELCVSKARGTLRKL